jgi:hypothetical protein
MQDCKDSHFFTDSMLFKENIEYKRDGTQQTELDKKWKKLIALFTFNKNVHKQFDNYTKF